MLSQSCEKVTSDVRLASGFSGTLSQQYLVNI